MEKVLIKKKQGFGYRIKRQIKHSSFLLIMIIPAIVYYAVFCYVPMYGVLIAFTRYSPYQGIGGSILNNWIGFENFRFIFKYPDFWKAFTNTIFIGTVKTIIAFLSAVTVALLINELRMRFFKKFVQIIVTFPHFLSWVVVASLFLLMLGSTGIINNVITHAGGESLKTFSRGK